jgi:probable F420-dependent oxidoreductase
MKKQSVLFGCSFSVDGSWDVAEFARRAENLGFDRISVGEHLMDGNPPNPTLLSLAAVAAAAGATSSIRVMTGIVIAPLYHPILLTKLVTTVDLVSGGRLDFGIGISGQRGTRIEYDALGISPNTRGRRLNEMLAVMKRIWSEEYVTHSGEFFDFKDVTLLPRPAQQPHPPIWIAGRSEEAMGRAATMGDGWYPYLFTLRRLKRSMESIRQYAADSGRDLEEFRWGVLQPIAIDQDRNLAMNLAVEKIGRRYATSEQDPAGIAGALSIVGTASDCIEAIEARVEAGVRVFDLVLLANDKADFYRRMEMVARDVLPYFRK